MHQVPKYKEYWMGKVYKAVHLANSRMCNVYEVRYIVIKLCQKVLTLPECT